MGDTGTSLYDSELLRRLDWVIETDETVHVVGTKNGTGVNKNLLAPAYNAVSAGRTDGLHAMGVADIESDYPAGRTRPLIVAPLGSTSSAAAALSSAVALLVETGHASPGLSTDPVVVATTNRNGDTVYNAERSEVIRAALMAGADRWTRNTTGADITDYRGASVNRSSNGLDTRFGAGQMNIYNGYHIIQAGEQNSVEDDPPGGGLIASRGFDYDPAFGGDGGSNAVGSYHIPTRGSAAVLTATLAWNIDIAGGDSDLFSVSGVLHDLDLYLYDETAASILVAASTANVDNSESLWLPLTAGHSYRLEVTTKYALQWDYALAWQILDDTDADGVTDAQDNCPQHANADQLDTDTDGAGNVCDADDDDDGLDDGSEAMLGTDPLLPDTDGDGFTDGVEVALGYDPLDTADAPVRGDLNNDALVDAADVLLATQAVLGMRDLTVTQLATGRVAPLVNGQPQPVAGVPFSVADLLLITGKAAGVAGAW